MATKYFATKCEFTLREDDWNDGEGDVISRWDEAEQMKSADTIEGVLKLVNYLNYDYGNSIEKLPLIEHQNDDFVGVFLNDPCQDKEYGRFDADLMVDLDDNDDNSILYDKIIKPTEEKWRQFERAEVKLYALHITVYIKKQVDLTADDIAKSSFCK